MACLGRLVSGLAKHNLVVVVVVVAHCQWQRAVFDQVRRGFSVIISQFEIKGRRSKLCFVLGRSGLGTNGSRRAQKKGEPLADASTCRFMCRQRVLLQLHHFGAHPQPQRLARLSPVTTHHAPIAAVRRRRSCDDAKHAQLAAARCPTCRRPACQRVIWRPSWMVFLARD